MNQQLPECTALFKTSALTHVAERARLGRAELLFLERVWGPAFQFNYTGLHVEYPCKRPREERALTAFVYVCGDLKLIIEIGELTSQYGDMDPEETDAYLTLFNDRMLAGWILLRYSVHQVEKTPQLCQAQLKQAIGHWWSHTRSKDGLQPEDADIWKLRKDLLVQMARQRNGILKPREVADAFQITSRAAINWLKRFRAEGIFTGVASNNHRLTRYKLNSELLSQ